MLQGKWCGVLLEADMTDANKEGIFGYYSATGDDAIISADPVSRITD